MNCKEFEDKFIFYLDEELSMIEIEQFEKHLESCSSCNNSLKKFKATYGVIEMEKEVRLLEPLFSDFDNDLFSQIPKKISMSVYTLRAVSIAAGLALILSLGIGMGSMYANKYTQTSDVEIIDNLGSYYFGNEQNISELNIQ